MAEKKATTVLGDGAVEGDESTVQPGTEDEQPTQPLKGRKAKEEDK